MKKFVIGAASAVALLGLAACGDSDGTTTQSVPPQQDQLQQQEPAVMPQEPAPATPAPAN